eukprot:GHVU01060519.1.p2 GENE.GHVU01060519.1~~GHVU01060519.1.p2  ORF type:complete len:111 (+),score=6.60 GHVU01060519.1:795-1127(+)
MSGGMNRNDGGSKHVTDDQDFDDMEFSDVEFSPKGNQRPLKARRTSHDVPAEYHVRFNECMHVRMSACVHGYPCGRVVHIHVYTYKCVCVCECAHICVPTCVCLCTYHSA